uniref:Fatty acyl-CoA reductase C-terminal domain-containing protein n=1 Tax=Timema poppense TaxID=170557 RepID=A0A7R9CQW3_TIMPO|nr:unnamed protein product [Timema poppensis]
MGLIHQCADQQPYFAVQWLCWEAHRLCVSIIHAGNGREEYVLGQRVDGVVKAGDTITVFQFWGCYWNGWPLYYPDRTTPIKNSHHETMGTRYETTMACVEKLKNAGNTVVEMGGGRGSLALSGFHRESSDTPLSTLPHLGRNTGSSWRRGEREKEVEEGYDDMWESKRRGYSHSMVRCWWERLCSLKLHVSSREGLMEGGSYTVCARPPVQLPDDADHIPIKKSQNAPDCNQNIPIYNYVSGPNTLTFQENTDVILERILEVPSAQAIWYPWGLPFRSVFWYRVFAIFVHVIPGALLDIAFVIKGNPPMLIKIYRKIDKYMVSMKYFTSFNWNFDNRNSMSLYKSLTPEDQEIFYFDSNSYDWRDYLRNSIDGGRVHLFKESLDTIPAGKSRLMKQNGYSLLYVDVRWLEQLRQFLDDLRCLLDLKEICPLQALDSWILIAGIRE